MMASRRNAAGMDVRQVPPPHAREDAHLLADPADAADCGLTHLIVTLSVCARMNCNGHREWMEWADERRAVKAATPPRSHNPPKRPALGRDGCAPFRPYSARLEFQPGTCHGPLLPRPNISGTLIP